MPTKLKPIVVAIAFAFAANAHMGWAADESKVGAQDEKTSGETKTSDDSAVTEMSPIQVRGVANGGYKANKSTSGTKTDTPILETPMAVQSVPQEVLEDRQTLSVQEAVKNVSGIQAASQFYDFFQIRGFFTTGGRFRDGLQLPNVYGGVNMAFVDHVEVAKGPTSMLYGRIEPGGLVNMVTKKPQAITAYSLEQQVGSWGAYASYSQSFGQSFPPAYSFTNSVLGPEKGVQYELGAKASLLGGKITTSATYFDLYKRNVIQSDPVNVGFMIAIGEIRSQGLELDISGEVTEHVSLIGSYTYDSAVITKDVSPVGNTQGNRMAGVPLHSASLWAKYDMAPGAPEGWALGAGAYLNGQRQGDNANSFQLPGYGRVDAMVSYHTKAAGQKVTAQLNVNNLFDKAYFESGGNAMGGGSPGALYGAPRNLMASVKVDFK